MSSVVVNKLALDAAFEASERRGRKQAQNETLSFLIQHMIDHKEVDTKEQVPCDNHAKAMLMILRAIRDKQFDGRLERNSVELGEGGDVLHVLLSKSEKNVKQRHVAIWWKCPSTGSGGRTAEIGFGPNYYDTYDSLLRAIRSALDSDRE